MPFTASLIKSIVFALRTQSGPFGAFPKIKITLARIKTVDGQKLKLELPAATGEVAGTRVEAFPGFLGAVKQQMG